MLLFSILFLFVIIFLFDVNAFSGLESVAGSVDGVQMTTYVSSSLCLSTPMMYPTIEHSTWIWFKDSSLRKLDKSWSVH